MKILLLAVGIGEALTYQTVHILLLCTGKKFADDDQVGSVWNGPCHFTLYSYKN